MTSIINASTTAGVVVSPDTSGSLALQANGTNIATVQSTGMTISSYSAGTSLITSGTAQATTSGTSITFTGIPSWVKRITVTILGVNTSGSSGLQLQVGTSGGIVSSGYLFYFSQTGGSTDKSTSTSGFASFPNSVTNALRSGTFVLTQLTGNTWVCTELIGFNYSSNYYTSQGAGSIALGSALTQVSLATTNGTDTFTAGSVNILYE